MQLLSDGFMWKKDLKKKNNNNELAWFSLFPLIGTFKYWVLWSFNISYWRKEDLCIRSQKFGIMYYWFHPSISIATTWKINTRGHESMLCFLLITGRGEDPMPSSFHWIKASICCATANWGAFEVLLAWWFRYTCLLC